MLNRCRRGSSRRQGRWWSRTLATLYGECLTMTSRANAKELTPVEARALASVGGSLCLSNLESLSPEVAGALRKHRGDLYLSGLLTLSAEAARRLAEHKGRSLALNAIRELPREAEEALSRYDGVLVLAGLKEIKSAKLVDKLCESYAELAEDMCVNYFSLQHFEIISPEAVEAWSAHEDEIRLSGIKEITPSVAEALARHNGQLTLNCVTCLTRDVAEALSRHKGGSLTLSKLTELSDEVAILLAQRKAPLHLGGLEKLTVEAATS